MGEVTGRVREGVLSLQGKLEYLLLSGDIKRGKGI
jgi:hypothetical protein